MSFDDAKTFQGRAYSGMSVGGVHSWTYPDGRWLEQKLEPDVWGFTFHSVKRRRRPAPPHTGAKPGTMYHWFLQGHQRVRKLDENTYATFLQGTKWKVGHRRPHWRRWSSEYAEQVGARERTIRILEETLAQLRREAAADAPPLETLLDPAVYRPVDAGAAHAEQYHLGEFQPDFYADEHHPED